MNRTIRSRFFFVSPWLLAAATGLLILIVVTFTLSNVQREKQLMTDAMLQKGATLMRVVGSGARSAHMADLRRGGWNTGSWNEYVQRIINHVSEDPDVRFLTVIDSQGMVVAHTDSNTIGTIIEKRPEPAETVKTPDKARITYQVENVEGYGRVFIIARPFRPFFPAMPSMYLHNQSRCEDETGSKSPGMLNNRSRFYRGLHGGNHLYSVVVGLDMKGYEKSLQRLHFQALMLSLAMLLVGLGGWLSLAAVQGYRLSQKALSDIQAFTGLLVSRLPVGIIATDQQGRVSTWNQAAADMTSISSQKSLGKVVNKYLPRELAAFFSSESESFKSEAEPEGREIRLVINGCGLVLHCQRIDLRDPEEKYMGQVLLLSDITRLKDLESEMRENERLAAVGRMAAGVAHEVRNPLSSIKGLALLLKGAFSRESREFETTGLLIQEVERMNRTISELLSFARPASLDLQQVDVQELLSETLKLVAADTAGEYISTSLHCEHDLPAVLADRDRLSQVFINIILNGAQAMEPGGTLDIIARTSSSGKQVELQFKDSGKGIESEHMSQLFFPYFTTKKGGTGIGLAISQKIIVDHGGTIRVESEPGSGTTVFVELPVND
ncbi:MAG: ATP-binding protein [Thermodesulfobacteriota bacterium]|nr:ATP-binding protein [Thermodesulfobacteriota bacterium]